MKAHGFHGFFQIFSKTQTSSTIGTSPVWWNSHPIPWKRHGASKNQRFNSTVGPTVTFRRALYFCWKCGNKNCVQVLLIQPESVVWNLDFYKSFIGRNLWVLFSCNILLSRPTFGTCMSHQYSLGFMFSIQAMLRAHMLRDASRNSGTVKCRQMKVIYQKLYSYANIFTDSVYKQFIIYDAAGQKTCRLDDSTSEKQKKKKKKKKNTCWVPVYFPCRQHEIRKYPSVQPCVKSLSVVL